ncbi:UNKNOWN [Stylonychia lemnae]|uniref:Uncharacterized protein n=1 Tax=Stylonychia lemnae TaxID=5949 RepID=A0A077ZWZ7_STYLE|nr:UNKNOWN [Stylonychia lemnae]|eukprot:CDW73031.1 UNKNOWN [Stylonychia lemnae]
MLGSDDIASTENGKRIFRIGEVINKWNKYTFRGSQKNYKNILNIRNLCVVLVSVLLVLVLTQLKTRYYAISTGDYSAEPRQIQYAKKISSYEYEKQKYLYTQEQIHKLQKSKLYKDKMAQIEAQRQQ